MFDFFFFPVQTADSKTTEIILKNLKPESLYTAFMMLGTFGGSLNGSTITFKTDHFGWYWIIICHSVLFLVYICQLIITFFFVFVLRYDDNRIWSRSFIDHHHRFLSIFLHTKKVRGSLLYFHLKAENYVYSCHIFFFSSRIKVRLWPDVPDPANSSIKRWPPESTQVWNIENPLNGNSQN